MPNPRLRFKKADGTDYPDWEKKKLGELTYKTGVKNKNNLDLETYSINNIDGFVPQKEQFENAGYLKNADRSIYYIVSHGSFAYNPARINVGSIGFQNLRKDVLVSSLYEIFNTKDELNDKFLMNYFQTINFKNNVKKYSEGGVRSYFYYDKLCSLNVFIPCLEEQNKIADFLSDIDEVILASDQEVKKLQELKKGAMQKIFSQEVRFKRDDGTYYPDWEEKKLIDIFNIRNGYTPSKQEESYWKGNTIIPWLRLEDIRENGRILKDSIQHVTPSAVKGELFKKNSIIISTTATIGEHALIEVDFLANQQFTILTLKNEFKEKFLHKFIFYHTYKLSNYSKNNIKSGGFHAVEMSKFKEFIFSIPCLEEQQKIGDFLSDFDEAISLAKQELEKWKLLKKGFLQQMFT